MTPSLSTFARGCLFGQIAGDNLGALVEFRSADSIAAMYPDGPRLLADGGCWGILAGQPTDDSEMALALARACVAAGGYDDAAVAEAYVAWGDSHPFDMGTTTRVALAALRGGGQPYYDSQANGALMRVSPIGILFAGDPRGAADAAEADAKLTHPHPVCIACNRAYAAALAVLVGGGDTGEAFTAAICGVGEGEGAKTAIKLLANAAMGKQPASYQHQMGHVVIAFQNAFYWLMRGVTVEEAVVATVREGGDTDTNAAIVGALLGACHGVEALPAQWVEAIEACVPCPGTMRQRPAIYWPNDAAFIADDLLALSGA